MHSRVDLPNGLLVSRHIRKTPWPWLWTQRTWFPHQMFNYHSDLTCGVKQSVLPNCHLSPCLLSSCSPDFKITLIYAWLTHMQASLEEGYWRPGVTGGFELFHVVAGKWTQILWKQHWAFITAKASSLKSILCMNWPQVFVMVLTS